MRPSLPTLTRTFTRLFTLCAALASMQPAQAVDGVVLIDQNRALAGNITPGDAPGFPVTITQPGSYRLSSNLSPPLYKSAIEVRAPNVNIDLNGFSLVAQPHPDQCCFDLGVLQTGVDAKGLVIANGSIVGFSSPFQASGNTGPDGILEPYPVVLRDLVLAIPSNSVASDIQLMPYSRVERVSAPKLLVFLHCPSSISGSAVDSVTLLTGANDIPGGKCVVTSTASR